MATTMPATVRSTAVRERRPTRLLVAAILAGLLGLGCGAEDEDVFAQLSGTVYVLDRDDQVLAVDPRTGTADLLQGAPTYTLSLGGPAHGRYLILSTRDLYRFDLDSRTLTPIIRDGFASFEPAVTPSGRLVAFVRPLPSGSGIFARDSSGQNEVVLRAPEHGAAALGLSWLGEHTLYFVRRDSVPRLWKVRADGSQLGRTRDTGAVAYGVAGAPAGDRLAVLYLTSGRDTVDVWELTPEGDRVREIARIAGGDGTSLTWSPDGQFLLTCSRTEPLLFIHVASGARKVINVPNVLFCPATWIGS